MNLNKASCDHGASAPPTAPVPVASKQRLATLRNALRNLAQWSHVLIREPRSRIPRLPASAGAAIVLALAAVVASMFLIDTQVSEWASHVPNWFRNAFERITDLGLGGWFLIPFGFTVLCLAAVTSPALPRLTQGVLAALAGRFGFLFLAIALPGLFDTIVKRFIGRARPFVGGRDDPFAYMPLIWRPEYASLPSGHATNVAAAAIAIGTLWPSARGAMWLYAFVIMFSRVVVLAHYPSDVIAGALIGGVGALLVRRWFAARRLVFSASDLSAYPRPSLRRIKAAIRVAVFGP